MSVNSNILENTITSIFAENAHNQQSLRKQLKGKTSKKAKTSKQELELALTVLLVELASSDQNFEPREYNAIASGLMRVFGTPRTEISALVNRANLTLANLRGTTRFAELLQKNLDKNTREQIMDVINSVIMADGVEEGFEIFLRQKFARLLDVSLT